MIRITISRDQVSNITKFTLSGHAGFANSGEDIVCSAVTAVSFGTINAIEKLLNVELEIDMKQDGGFLHCLVPEELDKTIQEKIQLLLEGMLVSLQSIASEYGKYITISDIKGGE